MKYQTLLLLISLFFIPGQTNAQSVAINTDGSTSNASALLDVKSTTKGLLIPRMSRTERNAIISPATGLLIFQNGPDSIGFHYFDGTRWSPVFSNSNSDLLAWRMGGNAGTIDGSHFIGTVDNIPFNIRVNNQKAGRIDHISGNSFYGYQAANSNTAGAGNTAVGYQSSLANQSGNNNTAVGYLASRDNTTGGQNTAAGYASMILNTGSNNTAYGFYSMYNNVAGSNATAIGYQSMLYANNSTSPFTNNNVAVGFESLKGSATPASNTGLNNTAIGYQTLFNNSSGISNTAIGYQTLYSNTTGNGNTAIGRSTLFSNTTGNNNVASGIQALYANIDGYNNTATGMEALKANTNGYNNTATGTQALYSNTTGMFNTATGVAALSSNTTGYNNTATGQQALNNNTDGIYNTATGMASLFFNTSGYNNTATGMDALRFNTTGNSNTATGMRSLDSNTVGTKNVATGMEALYSNTTGSQNTAIGNRALYSNKDGYNNTATGMDALYANTGGYFNTATGISALTSNTTGTSNTAMGQQALNSNVTGSNNTALGFQAGFSATGNSNVFLGLQAGYNETGNNKLYIANNAANPPIIYGDFSNKTLGFGTTTPNSTYGYAKVEIASEGFLAPTDLLIRNAANDAGYAPGLVFQHARGTLATPITVNNGDYLSAISTMNYDGSNYILSAGLDIYADGIIATGKVPTKLQFNTMNTAGNYAARLTIKNDGKVGIGTTSPSSKLHVGGGTRFTVLDTGAIFLQSGNTIGSARDWKIAVTLPNGYLSFRDMGFDNTGTGAMATDAMVMAWGTGNIGIATPTPAARLDVAADFKLGTSGSINNALIKSTQSIDVGSIAANSELDVTVTVTNASTSNSAIFVSPVADIEAGIVIAWARVSAANTVKIRFRNTTGSPIDPAAINYVISVLQ